MDIEKRLEAIEARLNAMPSPSDIHKAELMLTSATIENGDKGGLLGMVTYVIRHMNEGFDEMEYSTQENVARRELLVKTYGDGFDLRHEQDIVGLVKAMSDKIDRLESTATRLCAVGGTCH